MRSPSREDCGTSYDLGLLPIREVGWMLKANLTHTLDPTGGRDEREGQGQDLKDPDPLVS